MTLDCNLWFTNDAYSTIGGQVYGAGLDLSNGNRDWPQWTLSQPLSDWNESRVKKLEPEALQPLQKMPTKSSGFQQPKWSVILIQSGILMCYVYLKRGPTQDQIRKSVTSTQKVE